MNVFTKYSDAFNTMSVDKLFVKILDTEEVKTFIIEYITKRLYDSGLDKNNAQLRTDTATYGVYNVNTIKHKSKTRQPFDRVTLKETSNFYESFEISIKQKAIEIYADYLKVNEDREDGLSHISENFTYSYSGANNFEKAISDLTDEDWTFLINSILLDKTKKYILDELQ